MDINIALFSAKSDIEAEKLYQNTKKASKGPILPLDIEKQLKESEKYFFKCGAMWALKYFMDMHIDDIIKNKK